jgi:hypothetical protein
MPRLMTVFGFLGLAAVIALLSGHVIHNDLGVPTGTIRTDAFAGASLLGVLCALNFMKRKG